MEDDNSKDFEQLYLTEKAEREKFQKSYFEIQNDFDLFKQKRDETINSAVSEATKQLREKAQAASLKAMIYDYEKGDRITFQKDKTAPELRQLVKEQLTGKAFDDDGNFIDEKGNPATVRIIGKDLKTVKEVYTHMHTSLQFGIPNAVFPGDEAKMKIDQTGANALSDFFANKKGVYNPPPKKTRF